jgi:hypothetical protein
MLKFTLNEALASIGLLAVEAGLLKASVGPIFEEYEGSSAAVPLVIWYLGGVFVGMGALTLFIKPWIGAWLGLAACCLFQLCR